MSKRIVVSVCWNDGSLSVVDGERIEYRSPFVLLFGENKRKTWIRTAATRYFTVREEDGEVE